MSDDSCVVRVRMDTPHRSSNWSLLWRGVLPNANARVLVAIWLSETQAMRIGRQAGLHQWWVKAKTDHPLPLDDHFCHERALVYEELSKRLNKACGDGGLFVLAVQPYSGEKHERKVHRRGGS